MPGRIDYLNDFEMDDGYDPLGDAVEDADEDDDYHDSFAEIAPSNAGEPCAPADIDKVDERPAKERIEELFARMAPQRRTLLAVLNACFTPQPSEDVSELVGRMQSENRSVFGSDTLCELLERAGALEHVLEDGTPFSGVEAEPKRVVIDGVEYLEAPEPQRDYWCSTEAGRDYAALDKPLDRLEALLGQDENLAPVYEKILRLCAGMEVDGFVPPTDGMGVKELSDIVDGDPRLRTSPTKRLYTMYFLERLDECDAVEWRGGIWATAPVGLRHIDETGGRPAEQQD